MDDERLAYLDPEERKQHEDTEKESQRDERDYMNALRKLSNMPEGRILLRRIMMYTKPLNTTFTGNSTGMFAEGGRNIGLRFLDDMNHAQKNLGIKMLQQE